MLSSGASPGVALVQKTPAVTSNESPGRKNPTRRPVSAKTTAVIAARPPISDDPPNVVNFMEEVEQVVHVARRLWAKRPSLSRPPCRHMVRLPMPAAQAPTHRPTWLTVLTSAMLVYGGITLVGALLTLREPKAMSVMAIANMARPTEPPETMQKLEALSAELVDRHRGQIRAGALVSLAVGLLTLYAVAAILSRDPLGRRLAMLTACVGIAYQIGSLPLGVVMARQAAAQGGPVLAQVVIDSGRQPSGFTAAQLPQLMIIPAILAAALGVLCCLVLLGYFGGRRGRALYGLDLPRSDQG